MDNKKHTLDERLNGINDNCSLSKHEIEKCFGYYGMVGDVACDTRKRYDFKEGDVFKLCRYFKNI